MFREENLFFTFDDPVPDNRELKLQEYQNALQNGWMAINEVRRQEGLPDIKGGNSVLVPFSMTPFGAPEEQKALAIPMRKKDPQIMSVAEKLAKIVAPVAQKYIESQEFEKRGEVHWKAQIGRSAKFEKQISLIMDGYFDSQKGRVEDDLEKKVKTAKRRTKAAPKVFDEETEEAELIKVVKSIFETIVAEEGTAALSDLGVDEVLNTRTERMQKILEAQVKNFAGAVTEETSRQIREAIAAGLEEKEDLRDITKRIDELAAFSQDRSKRIARTEVVRSQNLASVQAWTESGIVEKKVWWTALDERVEEECAALHGKEFGLDDEISKNDYEIVESPPLHPNCRCTLLPVVSNKSISNFNLQKETIT